MNHKRNNNKKRNSIDSFIDWQASEYLFLTHTHTHTHTTPSPTPQKRLNRIIINSPTCLDSDHEFQNLKHTQDRESSFWISSQITPWSLSPMCPCEESLDPALLTFQTLGHATTMCLFHETKNTPVLLKIKGKLHFFTLKWCIATRTTR